MPVFSSAPKALPSAEDFARGDHGLGAVYESAWLVFRMLGERFDVVVTNTSIEPVTITSLTDNIYGNIAGQGNCAIGATLAANGGTYTYYIRCIDASGNANPDDYSVSFSVQQPSANQPPAVSVSAAGGPFTAPATVTLESVSNRGRGVERPRGLDGAASRERVSPPGDTSRSKKAKPGSGSTTRTPWSSMSTARSGWPTRSRPGRRARSASR